MGALFAGIVRAPMTSVLMIFEMTRDYAVIVPLMIANLTSLFISRRFQKQPIYEALAHQDGIHLPSPGTLHQKQPAHRGSGHAASPQILSAQMRVQDAVERDSLQSIPYLAGGGGGLFSGHVEQRNAGVRHGRWEKRTAAESDCGNASCSASPQDHALHLALERMSAYHLDLLPVVHRADIHKLIGVVTLKDVLDSYGVTALDRQ